MSPPWTLLILTYTLHFIVSTTSRNNNKWSATRKLSRTKKRTSWTCWFDEISRYVGAREKRMFEQMIIRCVNWTITESPGIHKYSTHIEPTYQMCNVVRINFRLRDNQSFSLGFSLAASSRLSGRLASERNKNSGKYKIVCRFCFKEEINGFCMLFRYVCQLATQRTRKAKLVRMNEQGSNWLLVE